VKINNSKSTLCKCLLTKREIQEILERLNQKQDNYITLDIITKRKEKYLIAGSSTFKTKFEAIQHIKHPCSM